MKFNEFINDQKHLLCQSRCSDHMKYRKYTEYTECTEYLGIPRNPRNTQNTQNTQKPQDCTEPQNLDPRIRDANSGRQNGTPKTVPQNGTPKRDPGTQTLHPDPRDRTLINSSFGTHWNPQIRDAKTGRQNGTPKTVPQNGTPEYGPQKRTPQFGTGWVGTHNCTLGGESETPELYNGTREYTESTEYTEYTEYTIQKFKTTIHKIEF